MSERPKMAVSVDENRNLLEIGFAGCIAVTDFGAAELAVRAALAKLRPGFTVLSDLTALDAMDLDCVAPLTKMMDLFKASGVQTAVRVISDPEKDIGFNILAITHYRRGVKVITCATRAEAERALG